MGACASSSSDFDFDCVVIGAGSGGLTAADFAAKLGARVALVEKNRVGGDCTWHGCVPSKALIHCASKVHAARRGSKYGVKAPAGGVEVDMAQVREYVRSVIADVYKLEAPETIEAKNVKLIMGAASFVDAHTIAVRPAEGGPGSDEVTSKYFLVCTGAAPRIPDIPGLDSVPYKVRLPPMFATGDEE